MEYIIIGLLVCIIVLLIIILTKKSNNEEMTLRLGQFENDMTKSLGDFKYDFSKAIEHDFKETNEVIEKRLNYINDKVNERLDVNFEKTNKTFASVLERISKIDEAQKKIDGLSNDIISLQSVLTDKKTRGIFGETNLNYILDSVFGVNDKIYKTQVTLPNGYIADAMLYAPSPLGTIAIDSKFPLEHYQIMTDKANDKAVRDEATKLFKADVKKHIDAIKNKYIIPGVTSSEAIMFLPAEAIFAEINAYHSDLIEYSYKSKVWITSPTTLMSTLTVISMVLKNMERDKYAKVIHDELNKLGVEFDRYKERWDKLSRSINTVSKDVEDIHTTTDKISKRFISISNVNLELNKPEDKEE
jgi:DNA recombination protein RmuC